MAASVGPTSQGFRNWVVSRDCALSGVDVFARNLVIFPGATLALDNCIVKIARNILNLGKLEVKRSTVTGEKLYAGYPGTLGELQEMVGLSDEELSALTSLLESRAEASRG